MKLGLAIIAFVISVTALMIVLDARDNDLMEAAEIYEDCVRKEYGVSPAYWYAEHGEYPTCPATTAQ